MFVVACLAIAAPVHADGTTDAQAERNGLLHKAWGDAPPPSFYIGMWTRHLTHTGIGNNDSVGGSWHGLFGGTFVNSYHTRSYAVGLERRVAGRRSGPITINAGYRLGVIRGPLAESAFTTMMVSHGNDWTVLMGRTISATVMVLAVLAMVSPIQRQLREKTRRSGS